MIVYPPWSARGYCPVLLHAHLGMELQAWYYPTASESYHSRHRSESLPLNAPRHALPKINSQKRFLSGKSISIIPAHPRFLPPALGTAPPLSPTQGEALR
jgi:hypothetical protein